MMRISLAVAFCVVGSLATAAPPEARTTCQRNMISASFSSDGQWKALLSTELCSDGGFVTTVADIVQIVKNGVEPTKADDVFSVDDFGPNSRPLVEWISAQQLQITISNKALIGLRRDAYNGIKVKLKFEPDDPSERAQFLKDLGVGSK